MQTPFTVKQVRAVKKIADKQIKRSADHKQRNVAIGSTVMLHQNTYVLAPMFAIPAGSASNERIGNEINLSGLLMNFKFRSDTAQNVTSFRIRVYEDSDDTFSGPTSWTTVTQANMTSVGFTQNSTDVVLEPNDKFTIKTLVDQTFQVNQQVENGTMGLTKRVWIPFRKKYIFTQAGFSKYNNLYVTVMGNVPGGTAGTTGVGFVTMSYSIYYSD